MDAEQPPRRVVVVLDIDGVLADVRHRLHHLAVRPKRWDAFFAAAAEDNVLEVGSALAQDAATRNVDIVYLTGRPARLRAATEQWLAAKRLPTGQLLLRRDGDHRPGSVIKVEQLARIARHATVELFVDDDPRVVDAARAAGFAVQLADWMPLPEADALESAQSAQSAQPARSAQGTAIHELRTAQENAGKT